MPDRSRLTSVDLLRGAVMVVMALDHTRDFVNTQAQAFRPEDLTQTTTAIFLTRWITHFCAPVFMLCAGLGAFLRLDRTGGRVADLSRFLWTRGLWLVVLEITVVRLGFFFDVDYSGLIMLLVFWALGLSMIVLAGRVWLPWRVVAAISVAMIALHNLLDPIRAASLGSSAWLWRVLHEPGLLLPPPPVVIVAYPLIPWIGVMAAGFCFGARVSATASRSLALSDPIGSGADSGVLDHPRGQLLRRSSAVGRQCALVPQYHQVSAVVVIPSHDARPRDRRTRLD